MIGGHSRLGESWMAGPNPFAARDSRATRGAVPSPWREGDRMRRVRAMQKN